MCVYICCLLVAVYALHCGSGAAENHSTHISICLRARLFVGTYTVPCIPIFILYYNVISGVICRSFYEPHEYPHARTVYCIRLRFPDGVRWHIGHRWVEGPVRYSCRLRHETFHMYTLVCEDIVHNANAYIKRSYGIYI